MRRHPSADRVFCAALLLAATSLAASAAELVSVTPRGASGGGASLAPAISADGRFVAFTSEADNLVPGDRNGFPDIFLRDRKRGKTVLVSVGKGGAATDGQSYFAAMTPDARAVAFNSEATNLAAGDANGVMDVFVRDLAAGTTSLASVGNGGERCTEGCLLAALSADQRYVAFATQSANLDARTGTGHVNLFVRDRTWKRTILVTKGLQGAEADGTTSGFGLGLGLASFSADGRYLAFTSDATNLVDGDANGALDVFRFDLALRAVELVSAASGGGFTAPSGGSALPAISTDGRFVAFSSAAPDIVDSPIPVSGVTSYVRDMRAGTTRMIAAPGGAAPDDVTFVNGISADGRHVLLVSAATNLIAGVADRVPHAFVYDTATRTYAIADVGPSRAPGDDMVIPYIGGGIASDGRTTAFTSLASNLARGDANGAPDVFVGRATAQLPGLRRAPAAKRPAAVDAMIRKAWPGRFGG